MSTHAYSRLHRSHAKHLRTTHRHASVLTRFGIFTLESGVLAQVSQVKLTNGRFGKVGAFHVGTLKVGSS